MRAPVVALLLLIAGPATAQEVGVTIIEHGLYTAETVRTERLPSGFNSNIVQNICHIATTEAVPMKMGVQFGMRFRIDGAPAGAVVELNRVTRFPAPVTPPGNPRPQAESEHSIRARIGATSYAGFGFDHDWEMVRGPWVFEIWHGGRMLARQGFEIGEGQVPERRPSNDNCFELSASLSPGPKTGGM